jgi:hypothetical protein
MNVPVLRKWVRYAALSVHICDTYQCRPSLEGRKCLKVLPLHFNGRDNSTFSVVKSYLHSCILTTEYIALLEWRFPFVMLNCTPTIFSPNGATAPSGPEPPHYRGFTITHTYTPHSVGLLWTSDQPDAETSTWQHTTRTRDRRPCPQRDSNLQSQQASGCRPTP